VAAGCAIPVVSVLPTQASTGAPPRSPGPIAVVLNATAVRLPLVVSGADIAYGDVDRALARSVEQSLQSASPRLTLPPGAHLQLQVEIVDARAEYSSERLVIEMAVRATLRHTKGNAYIAQTHAHSTASAHAPPSRSASAVLACTDSIANQLTGWLLGIEPH
jgi:hypothetical protein